MTLPEPSGRNTPLCQSSSKGKRSDGPSPALTGPGPAAQRRTRGTATYRLVPELRSPSGGTRSSPCQLEAAPCSPAAPGAAGSRRGCAQERGPQGVPELDIPVLEPRSSDVAAVQLPVPNPGSKPGPFRPSLGMQGAGFLPEFDAHALCSRLQPRQPFSQPRFTPKIFSRVLGKRHIPGLRGEAALAEQRPPNQGAAKPRPVSPVGGLGGFKCGQGEHGEAFGGALSVSGGHIKLPGVAEDDTCWACHLCWAAGGRVSGRVSGRPRGLVPESVRDAARGLLATAADGCARRLREVSARWQQPN